MAWTEAKALQMMLANIIARYGKINGETFQRSLNAGSIRVSWPTFPKSRRTNSAVIKALLNTPPKPLKQIQGKRERLVRRKK